MKKISNFKYPFGLAQGGQISSPTRLPDGQVQSGSNKYQSRKSLRIGNWRLDIGYSHAGFTLIELLIYMGLFTILLGVLTSIFLSALDTQLESRSVSSVDQDARFILARLEYDIHRATSITQPASLGDTSNSLVLVVGGTNYTYSINNNNLVLANTNGTNQINGYDTTISNFSITRLGNAGGKNTLQISYTVTSKIQRTQGLETKTMTSTIGIR